MKHSKRVSLIKYSKPVPAEPCCYKCRAKFFLGRAAPTSSTHSLRSSHFYTLTLSHSHTLTLSTTQSPSFFHHWEFSHDVTHTPFKTPTLSHHSQSLPCHTIRNSYLVTSSAIPTLSHHLQSLLCHIIRNSYLVTPFAIPTLLLCVVQGRDFLLAWQPFLTLTIPQELVQPHVLGRGQFHPVCVFVCVFVCVCVCVYTSRSLGFW